MNEEVDKEEPETEEAQAQEVQPQTIPEGHVAIPREHLLHVLGKMGMPSDHASDEELVARLSHGVGAGRLKDVFDPGEISGWSTPTEPGTTSMALPTIDPAVKAMYQAQGFNTTGM